MTGEGVVCPSCGRDTREGARFCDGCGSALAPVCPDCGTDLRAEARFCDGCGRQLEAPRAEPPDPRSYTPDHLARRILADRSSLEGERRAVTVLFADARGFTPLTEQIGPERAYELVQGCLARMMEAVHRYEGTVNQFTGDGIMAIFGAPIAHEDSARRAVSAALEMQASLTEYAEEVKAAHPGMACAFRVGLNTGPVVVGRVGDDLTMEYTAVGDTTNLASRMEGLAEPGTVYLTEATYRQVADYVECEDLGPHEVKGKADLVRVYKAVRERPVRTRFEAAAIRGLTRFVGRERELAVLRDFHEQASGGRGQTVFVSGEAGIGKSRLLLEFRRGLPGTTRWWQGNCISYGESIPYLPVIDLVKDAFSVEEGDDDGAIIRKVDEATGGWDVEAQKTVPYLKWLLQVDPGDPTVTEQDPRDRRAGLLAGLRELFLEEARRGPFVAAVEDLHWADERSADALRALADVIPSCPVLLVATLRPGYEQPLEGLPQTSRLAIGHLDAGEDAQLARSVLEASALPSELAEIITSKAEGNPLYIEEVAKALVESGALRRRGEGYELARDVPASTIPDTVQDVILSRIDRLAGEAREALQLASVIGREFTVRLLDRIADLRSELDDVLGQLKSLELIYERAYFPELAYMFKHALTHEVAYSTLLDERRKALHRVVASAVEEVYADRLAEQYETLAHHYLAGESWEKALDYLELSGDKAAAALANREAVAFYGRALDVCDRLGEPELRRSVALARKRGLLSMNLGDFEDALVEFDRLISVGRVLGDRHLEGMGQALRGFTLFWAHRFDECEETVGRALSIGRSGEEEVRAVAAYVLSLMWTVTGRHREARPLSEERDRFADAIEPSLRAFVTFQLSMEAHWEGRTNAETHLDAQADVIDRVADIRLFALWERGLQRGLRGEYEAALEVLHESLEASRKADFVIVEMRALNTIGWVHGEIQDHSEALDWNRRSLDLANETEIPDYEIEGNARVNIGDSLMALGRLDEAEEQFRRVEAVYRSPSPADLWMLWRYAQHLLHSFGELRLLRGDPEGALAYADECLELAEGTSSLKNVIKGRRLRGQALTARGQLDEAEAELLTGLENAEGLGNPPQLWRTHAALGDLRRRQGRDDDARAAIRDASAVAQRVAEGLSDPELRETFLDSDEVRRIREGAHA